MFIHIGAFNFITVNLSSSASKNGKVRNRVAYKKKKKKNLRTETCPRANFYYRVGGNLTKN